MASDTKARIATRYIGEFKYSCILTVEGIDILVGLFSTWNTNTENLFLKQVLAKRFMSENRKAKNRALKNKI